jgi:transposase
MPTESEMIREIYRYVKKQQAVEKIADDEEWLSDEEAMIFLGCKKRTLYNLRKAGKVDFKCRPGKIDRDFKYSKESLQKLYA